MDKIIADTVKGVILSEVLNSLSSRFFSFTNLVMREGSINLFFKLLDSSGKSAEIS
jgi:hypothetical protein